MKKFFVIALLLALTSCSELFKTASSVARSAEIGMSLNEFKRMAGLQAELDMLTASETVYRMNEYSGDVDHHYVSSYKLFFFDSEERLYKIESRDVPGAVLRDIIDTAGRDKD
jgi:hypothetical protein